MKRIILLFGFLLFLVMVKGDYVFAQATPTPVDYNLPYPGILPDHPLYPLKKIRDWLLVTFTRDPLRKVDIHLLLSDKKLVMGQILLEKGNTTLGVNTINEAEKHLLQASTSLSDLKDAANLPPGLADKLQLAAEKHKEVINNQSSTIIDNQYLKKLNEGIALNNQATSQILSVK